MWVIICYVVDMDTISSQAQMYYVDAGNLRHIDRESEWQYLTAKSRAPDVPDV